MEAPSNDVDLEKGLAAARPSPERTTSLGINFDQVQPGTILPGMNYEQRIFHYTCHSADERMLFMEFGILQRLNLIEFQNELAQIKGAIGIGMSASAGNIQKLRVTMREYGKKFTHDAADT
jgi:hypothetical protein